MEKEGLMMDVAHREELAGFLRSRRERLAPLDAGVRAGPRRRTPGLRREEVAQLSGVSLTWYTWLEQARDITVSRQVLDAVARALQLPATERRYLFALAGEHLPADPAPAPVSPTLQRLVDSLDPNPAYLVNPCYDILAWNRAEAGLIGDPARLPDAERNTIWLLFTDPAMRTLLVDWRGEAQRLLAQYRAAAGHHVGDPRFEALTTALYAASSEFRQCWERHDIAGFQPARKQFDHPHLGLLTLDYVKLAAVDHPDVKLVTYLPADEETRLKLPRLDQHNETTVATSM